MKNVAIAVPKDTFVEVSKLKLDYGLRRKGTIIQALLRFAKEKCALEIIEAYCQELEAE